MILRIFGKASFLINMECRRMTVISKVWLLGFCSVVGILSMKAIFLRFKVGSGEMILVWLDEWVREETLAS